jgi:hypothetical protein
MVEIHLPCPPLGEWLPLRFAGMRVAAWAPKQAPRRVRSALAQWPLLDAEGGEGPSAAGVDALLFGVSLERPAPPEACLASLPAGAWVVELAVPRPRVLRSLLGLGPRPLSRAKAGQSRVLAWLARGYHEVEQWESVDPHGVIVTLARVR